MFTETTKKKSVANKIQTKLIRKNGLGCASVSERIIITTWVSGSTAKAKYRTKSGRSESEKNVPLKRNIGVMNRNEG